MQTPSERIEANNLRITERVIASIESGIESGKWTPPWAESDVWSPFNPVTGRRYTAGNRFNLGIVAWMMGYGMHWATYDQWSSLTRHSPACVDMQARDVPIHKDRCQANGCELVHVRKGERGTMAVRPLFRKDKETGEENVVGFRPYSVFAAAQVEGYDEPKPPAVQVEEADEMEAADAYARAVGVELEHHDVMGASYSPKLDRIMMPAHDRWTEPDRYWATLVHEMMHWTGHDSRLKRETIEDHSTLAYGKEELIAELGACFHLSHLGRLSHFREDHVPYLRGWLRILKAEPRALWDAATAAEKASKYVGARFREVMDVPSEATA